MEPAVDPLALRLAAAAGEIRSLFGDPQVAPKAALRRLCEISAEALRVERVGVWLFAHAGKALRCVSVYECSSGQHSEGTTLLTADFPRYFAGLAVSPAVAAGDALADLRTRELAGPYLKPLNIASLLDAPILRGGALVGVLCHEHVGPAREWTAEEVAYADAAGRLVAGGAELHDPLGLVDSLTANAREFELAGQLAAGVAHDFKNLLTVVLGNAELLARQPELSARSQGFVRRILEAAERGDRLTTDLMLIVRNRPRETQVVSPSEVIERALPLLQELAGALHPIELTRHNGAGRVFLDPSSLERVVTNLVTNARDATPGGGPIAIAIDDAASPFDGEPGRHYKMVAVSDRGTGIDPAIRDRLFDPFLTTKASGKGTGLGLAIVKQIVDRAGGQIRVESEVGRGTTFRIYLPRVSCAPAGD